MLVGEPLLAQQEQGPLGQGNVAIVLAFAAAEVEQPALAIDVADFQAQAFAQAQAARVNERQTNPMIQRGDGGQHAANLGNGEDDREFETRIGAGELDLDGPGTAAGFFPKELDLPAGRQVAQRAWVEVCRASCFSVLRCRKYCRSSSAEMRSGDLA